MITPDALRAALLAKNDLERRIIDTPEWAPELPRIEVRGMTAAGWAKRMDVLDEAPQRPDGQTIMPWRALYPSTLRDCVYVPDTDQRVFDGWTDDEILSRSLKVLERLTAAANDLSGSGAPAEEPAPE